MTRTQADGLLAGLEAQVNRVRNNGARRRLRRALEKARTKRARTLEIERRRADRAKTLTISIPIHQTESENLQSEPGPFVSRPLRGFPARQADHDAVLREITYPVGAR